MKKVPEILSTKDLSYLEDMFNWHITIAKKASHYAEEVEDSEIKKHMELVEKKHTKICRDIIKIIEKGNV